MSFLLEECTFRAFTHDLVPSAQTFDCENKDLNDFFKNDSLLYSQQLLGKTYCYTLNENPTEVVSFFTVSNDGIRTSHMPNGRKKKLIRFINRAKHMANYPAVMIGRLGVDKKYRGKAIGTDMMNVIKYWFIDVNNKTGCRYLVVDSYNVEKTLKFYKEKCGFTEMFHTEAQEKDYTGNSRSGKLITRLLYFDLIVLKTEE